ncbi:NfeD family protein [Vibrio rarus]|uniref:NfeD family protein n=1 Tax=Vibrio rarus TaxID=413403 RepID=UPI0021C44450|nr:NfeD family protein [Vibrio rarus]
MIELLQQLNHWHWLALGLALLCFEVLGTAGYCLWLGISALVVGLLLTLLPLGWQMQWMSFASFSMITTWLWWRYQTGKDQKDEQTTTLNKRSQSLIGQFTVLDTDFPIGKGRIKLGDTSWSAMTEHNLAAGTTVEVYKVEGIVLYIRVKK